MGNAVNNGENITYTGNCDVIRTSKGFSWREFLGDVISSCLMQWTFIKKDDKIVKDISGERYLYWGIKNEQNEEIYVWEGFFKENTNL